MLVLQASSLENDQFLMKRLNWVHKDENIVVTIIAVGVDFSLFFTCQSIHKSVNKLSKSQSQSRELTKDLLALLKPARS